MKHYTKEWQALLAQMDLSDGLKVIEDKEYSDQDVLDYIQSQEDERVVEDREVFDTMPNLDFEINLINEMYDSSEISLEEKYKAIIALFGIYISIAKINGNIKDEYKDYIEYIKNSLRTS